MLPIPRPSPRIKAGLAVAAALLLWVPMGISTQTQPVVTGHSTFFNGEVYDQCLASVAGILRSRVMWFNDQILVERYPGKGNFVYVTEHGGEDPTDKLYLRSDGVVYDFVDPNGAAWHVQELYILKSRSVHHDVDAVIPGEPDELDEEDLNREPEVNQTAEVREDRQYVWVVEIAATPIYDEFPGDDAHTLYNFLTLVDTCKFHNNTVTRGLQVEHTNASVLNDHNGHPNGDDPHTHESWNADIYVGKRPNVLVAGASTDGAVFESQWATSESGQQNTAKAYERTGEDAQRRTEPYR